MLIKLDDNGNTYIAADSIEGIACNSQRDTLTVTMKSGERHTVGRDYNKSIWETMKRIMVDVDVALAKRDGEQPLLFAQD